MKTIKYIAISILTLCSLTIKAQTTDDKNIIKAIDDELTRSKNELKMEGFETPYFIAFSVTKYNRLNINATLGAIIASTINSGLSNSYSVKYGSNKLNDENFVSQSQNRSSQYISFPVDNDYSAIRRAVWSGLDGSYKNAITTYRQKLQEIEQQNLTELIDDYAEAPVVSYFPTMKAEVYNVGNLETLAKKLSLLFKNHPNIQTSKVEIVGFDGITYFVNTDGTKTAFPTTSIMLKASCSKLTLDGEELNDDQTFLAPTANKLPTYEVMALEIEKMAQGLIELSDASMISEDYSGPVLFEKSAVSELVSLRLFSGTSSLIASRTPIYATEMKNTVIESNVFENRLKQKVFPHDVSIKVYSRLKEYKGTPLVGAFEIDNEGVVPADEITLVDSGLVVNLLNKRVPSQKINASNGYCRQKGQGSDMMAPGTVDMMFANGKSPAELKKSLLEMAKANGLTHAYIVRKMAAPAGNSSSRTRPDQPKANKAFANLQQVYKVDVNTGAETLVRSAEIKTLSESSLKTMLGCKDERFVVNTMLNSGGQTSIPVSYILPEAILFSELDINKRKRSVSTAQPFVDSPLTSK